MRRAWANDARGAVGLVEGAIASHVFVALGEALRFQDENVFGGKVQVEGAGPDRVAVVRAFVRKARAVGAGEGRVSLVADAAGLGAARAELRSLVEDRVGVVVHVLAEAGGADALALADLGFGLLFASTVEESIDLALVARRAAEDARTPFMVVHEDAPRRHLEAVAAPSRELCEALLGRVIDDAFIIAGESARAHAERVPFALGSAMRALEALTGRPLDVFERVPDVDAAIVLVAAGELGESLVAEVLALREQGHDVAAVKVTAFRPFPGPSLVKATSRAHAISVLETVDEPLAQSNPLTREVKSAFADALTWAPDYPGIGRIPRILSGVVGRAGHELEPHDLDAVVHNMLADERGRRHFVFGAGDALAPEGPPPGAVTGGAAEGTATSAKLSVRGCFADTEAALLAANLCSAVVSSVLGFRVRASVGALSPREDREGGGGIAVDLLADRVRPRGRHVPRTVNLVLVADLPTLHEGNPLIRLAVGGLCAFPTAQRSADALWAEVPSYAKALIASRRARVVGWPGTNEPADAELGARAAAWLTAAAFAGVTLARGASGALPLDGPLVAREVMAAATFLLGAGGRENEKLAARVAEVACMAFAGLVEVPDATVARDQEALRLGRLDPRAAGA